MVAPILATKLYIPPLRSRSVPRPHLIERLNDGLRHKLILISAPAGFGKTTLISEWLHQIAEVSGVKEESTETLHPFASIAWLSLDEGDSDPIRFHIYLIAALQTIVPGIGAGVLAALQSPQPPPIAALLPALLNEIAAVPEHFILVLDDYHTLDSPPVDQALAFLLQHQPPHMHLVITTREDPPLPLARLRARDQMTELRTADLRFTPTEVTDFLNRVMSLDLSAEDIAALEGRTEGWIAGLQLAAISMQGHPDTASFIQSFTGSHHFVLDYLLAEVLQQQSERVQDFLLRTSILNHLCGPLCEAVLRDPEISGQETLEFLERANLFIVPMDKERRWYRYHRLFEDLLHNRLRQSRTTDEINEFHSRASQWFEDQGLLLEAFHHAAAANHVARAERLIDSKEMSLHFSGTLTTILNWLISLPETVKDGRPSLWVKSATLALMAGQTAGVEERLQAAENAIQHLDLNDAMRNLIGVIAAARATLALTRYEAETIFIQAQRALAYLHPDNLPFRFTAVWTLAFAYRLQGNRTAAMQAYSEAIAISQASGDTFSTLLATDSLGEVQELENQLYSAAESYRRMLELTGDHPHPNAGETHLGLARIYYEWNDLEAAERHGQKSLQLVQQYDRVIDRFVISEVFLARLKLAQGDVAGAAEMLAQTEQSVRRHNFLQRLPEVTAVQVLVQLRQGNLTAAVHLAHTFDLPTSQARVFLAQGDTAAALAVLVPLHQQMDAKGWQDEKLRVMVLQASALFLHGHKPEAVQMLNKALALAEPGGFIRLFVDEGPPMARLLHEALSQGIAPGYIQRLLAAFSPGESQQAVPPLAKVSGMDLVEPLSERELEVLHLIAAGLTNQEIANRLYLSLHTVKVHARNLYAKLDVGNRTQAVAKARSLGILSV